MGLLVCSGQQLLWDAVAMLLLMRYLRPSLQALGA